MGIFFIKTNSQESIVLKKEKVKVDDMVIIKSCNYNKCLVISQMPKCEFPP